MPYWRPGQKLTADRLAMEPEDWDPTVTSFTLGNGSIEGWRTRAGNLAFYGVKISLGSTSEITTTLRISMPYPVALLPSAAFDYGDVVGIWQYRVDGGENYGGPATMYDATNMCLAGSWQTAGTSSGPSNRVGVDSGTTPVDSATGHVLTVGGTYPIQDGS